MNPEKRQFLASLNEQKAADDRERDALVSLCGCVGCRTGSPLGCCRHSIDPGYMQAVYSYTGE